MYNTISNCSNPSCPLYINYNNNGATVLETMGCSSWSFQMPCLLGDALCGLPVNPSACDGNTAISLAAPFKLVFFNETNKKENGQKNNKKIKEFYEQLSDYP